MRTEEFTICFSLVEREAATHILMCQRRASHLGRQHTRSWDITQCAEKFMGEVQELGLNWDFPEWHQCLCPNNGNLRNPTLIHLYMSNGFCEYWRSKMILNRGKWIPEWMLTGAFISMHHGKHAAFNNWLWWKWENSTITTVFSSRNSSNAMKFVLVNISRVIVVWKWRSFVNLWSKRTALPNFHTTYSQEKTR